ncbi:hypothetical protein PI125_g23876 [Phytophthora idaei]|nr:hypothetical protein PI125_g23876 [Phytophthora idaei]
MVTVSTATMTTRASTRAMATAIATTKAMAVVTATRATAGTAMTTATTTTAMATTTTAMVITTTATTRDTATVMSYYRHVKNWLLDTYPKHRAVIEKKSLKMDQALERHCLKRVEGGLIKKAPACTKEDLRILMDELYYDAASPKDYQDAALLALMWYAFRRASNVRFVVKGNLSVSAEGVVFVRLVRVKTAEEQGLSLFPDRDSFITCPLHAIAMALVMQDSPCAQLLDHPHLAAGSEESVPAPADVPLAEALASCEDDVSRVNLLKRSARCLKIT